MQLSCPRGILSLHSDDYRATHEDRNSARRRRNFSRRLELLWSDYFKDPSQWWDIRKSKVRPSSPDFKHKVTKQPLWLHGRYNPCWVQEELRRLGLLPAEAGKSRVSDVENESAKENDGSCCATSWCEDADDLKEEKASNNLLFLPDASDEALSLLKDCAHRKNLSEGFAIHSRLIRRNLVETNVFVCNTLLNMYAECGALEEAQDVFDESMVRNVVLWSTLVGGYAKHGQGEKALMRFKQMQSEGVSPNAVTFVSVLKACTNIEALYEGQRIHSQILKTSLLNKNVVVATALVDMYAKCGSLEKSQRLFNDLAVRNEISWTALIAGYTQHELNEKAMDCYELMQAEGFCPNAVTFVCILKACGGLGVLNKGQFVHAQIMRERTLLENTMLTSALVSMYAKCGAIGRAQEVFDMFQVRNVSLWNALITGYTQHGLAEEALSCFEQMQLEGISPDVITYICILKACGNLGAADKGQDIYAQVVRGRLLEGSIAVACAAVDMHAKCGSFQMAREVLDEVAVQSVILWNALINGYVEYGHHEEALECFEEMQLSGLSPDVGTFVCIMKSCSSTGAMSQGQFLHSAIVSFGFLDNEAVGTVLIDMYSNYGMWMEAKAVFDMLGVRDVVSWSALMVGFAQLGRDDIVFTLFEKMVGSGASPNAVTFLIVLSVCSHRGLLEKGQMYFEVMITSYGLFPTSEHFNNMLDLFSRAGLLEEAIGVIIEMPLLADGTLWHTFLAACTKWGLTKFGREAFDHAVQTNGKHPLPFVYMGNICAGSGRQYIADEF